MSILHIIVSGDTYKVKDILKKAGFIWENKKWRGKFEKHKLVNF
jgi:hypothetical protein